MTALPQLQADGYCVIEQVLDQTDMDWLRSLCGQALSNVSAEHRERNRSQGSLVLIADYPEFGRLLGHPVLSKIFDELEFRDPKFSSGYIISKPPQSPALFWHQDWWGWNEQSSFTDQMAQVFVMIYLQDTQPQNGCLRVIPGSHRKLHELHYVNAHTESLSRVENPNDRLFESLPDQVAVPINSGDVIVGDARLIHGAFPNEQSEDRTLITLWFHPNYNSLTPALQSRISEIFLRTGVDTDPDAPEKKTPLDWPDENRIGCDFYFPKKLAGIDPNPWCRIPERE